MDTTHYIFVDFENVHSVDLDLVKGKPVRVVIVVGRNQTRVSLPLVKQLMQYAAQVRLIESEISGRNALDFVLAWEAGRQAAADPAGVIHIVSGDTGFDSMIAHMRRCGIKAGRHPSFASVPVLKSGHAPPPAPAKALPKPVPPKPAAPKPAPPPAPAPPSRPVTLKSRAEEVRRWLVKNPDNRPKRKKTLSALILSNIAKDLTDADLQVILDRLVARGIITVGDGGVVSYPGLLRGAAAKDAAIPYLPGLGN